MIGGKIGPLVRGTTRVGFLRSPLTISIDPKIPPFNIIYVLLVTYEVGLSKFFFFLRIKHVENTTYFFLSGAEG